MRRISAIVSAAVSLFALTGSSSQAAVTDCTDMYVGRVWLERGYLLRAVVLLDHRTDAYGSYWVYFDNWTLDEKKAALATLTAAKLSGQRVHVTTDEASGCGIALNAQQVKTLTLATTQ